MCVCVCVWRGGGGLGEHCRNRSRFGGCDVVLHLKLPDVVAKYHFHQQVHSKKWHKIH